VLAAEEAHDLAALFGAIAKRQQKEGLAGAVEAGKRALCGRRNRTGRCRDL
jgi:hypothetical protein